MWSLWFWSLLVATIVGLVAKYGFSSAKITTSNSRTYYQISWIEFAIVMAIIAIIVIPVTSVVGLKMAKASKLTYHEFWGGYETAALHSSQECHRDGSCEDEYNCDRYVTYETVTDYDSKGNAVGSHTVEHVHYHDCPVATHENYWSIDTTLGKYDLGMTFDENAVPFRDSHGLDDTPRGPPTMWTAAEARIRSGDPGPVTADKTYQNYILASTRTILHKFSDAVDKYRKAKLLPDPVANLKHPIHDYYYADKMTFVGGITPSGQWQFALSQLNAALGTDLQGDLHIVAVDTRKVSNVDEYVGAVNAWWQDKALGRRALSKNGIGLILGVSDGCHKDQDAVVCTPTIDWARAFTGMPVGNDGLVLDLQNNVTGTLFTPEILGHPYGTKNDAGKFKPSIGDSPVEKALWGPHKFHRVCMVCDDKEDSGTGYGYLGSEIQPSGGQKALIVTVAVLFSILFWAIALGTVVGEKTPITKGRESW